MTDGDALYRAILERPDDDAPRLVWADWLEEHGDPDRAEFVRIQCEWAALDRGDPRAEALLEHWRSILQVRGEQWLSELDGAIRPGGFWRGLPDWFEVTTDDVMTQVTRLRHQVPAQCLLLRLTGFKVELRHWPGLDLVRCLTLYEGALDPYYPHASLRGWVWLIQSPRLRGLRRFAAAFDVSSGAVLAALAGTDWPELRDLDLRMSGAEAGRPHRGWAELVEAPWFPHLRAVNLFGARLGDDGVVKLLGRGLPLALTELVLIDNDLTPAGIRRLIARPELSNLRVLIAGSRDRPPKFINGVAVYE
jgi:uncharacterized protein (TIGR02996 family)